MYRHACQDLSRNQSREFAYVLSTIELLEKEQQRTSGDCQSLCGGLFWYIFLILYYILCKIFFYILKMLLKISYELWILLSPSVLKMR